jgi:hypothetical protein
MSSIQPGRGLSLGVWVSGRGEWAGGGWGGHGLRFATAPLNVVNLSEHSPKDQSYKFIQYYSPP